MQIVRPTDRALVSPPITIEWTARGFRVVGPDGSSSPDRGYFGIFIDRAPMAPGQTLASLAEGDEDCVRRPSCPDADWFAARGVFTSLQTRFTRGDLTDTRSVDDPDARDAHEVVVVLLDGQSKRIGEAAFGVEFFVDRRDDQ